MRLRPEENILAGAWTLEGDRVIADEVCRRIRVLVEEELQLVSSSDGGWTKLYFDPADGRYWALTYPQSEMRGAGPPRLIHIPADDVKIKYGVDCLNTGTIL